MPPLILGSILIAGVMIALAIAFVGRGKPVSGNVRANPGRKILEATREIELDYAGTELARAFGRLAADEQLARFGRLSQPPPSPAPPATSPPNP